MAHNNKIHGNLICTEEGYQTCDLYFAAFLATAKCPIINTSRDRNKVYFLFEYNEIILKLKSAYFLWQVELDALSYVENINSLKSL